MDDDDREDEEVASIFTVFRGDASVVGVHKLTPGPELPGSSPEKVLFQGGASWLGCRGRGGKAQHAIGAPKMPHVGPGTQRRPYSGKVTPGPVNNAAQRRAGVAGPAKPLLERRDSRENCTSPSDLSPGCAFSALRRSEPRPRHSRAAREPRNLRRTVFTRQRQRQRGCGPNSPSNFPFMRSPATIVGSVGDQDQDESERSRPPSRNLKTPTPTRSEASQSPNSPQNWHFEAMLESLTAGATGDEEWPWADEPATPPILQPAPLLQAPPAAPPPSEAQQLSDAQQLFAQQRHAQLLHARLTRQQQDGPQPQQDRPGPDFWQPPPPPPPHRAPHAAAGDARPQLPPPRNLAPPQPGALHYVGAPRPPLAFAPPPGAFYYGAPGYAAPTQGYYAAPPSMMMPAFAAPFAPPFPAAHFETRAPLQPHMAHLGPRLLEALPQQCAELSASAPVYPGDYAARAGKAAAQEPEDRHSLVESPATRLAFKKFYRELRQREKESFECAKAFALARLEALPRQVHWRLYLELADLAKRENDWAEARRLYRAACVDQPFVAQGWLEYSKMEDECGDAAKAAAIVRRGLDFCDGSDALLTRAIKHAERTGCVSEARALLARLKHVPIDKVWRAVLEGALLEARAGHEEVARKVLQYVRARVPWYGPIYFEAFRHEERCGHDGAALDIVEHGIVEIPRYGPLWFGALRCCERLDIADLEKVHLRRRFHGGTVPSEPEPLERTAAMLSRCVDLISKELLWKVHFEAAQIEERRAARVDHLFDDSLDELDDEEEDDEDESDDDSTESSPRDCVASCKKSLTRDEKELRKSLRAKAFEAARCRYAAAISACPANLKWKVWLAGGRMELGARRVCRARRLFARAFDDVPAKSRAFVYLECARLEEFLGRVDVARSVLKLARTDAAHEWKVYLEAVLLEMRAGRNGAAADCGAAALRAHASTGRLWAVVVQLKRQRGGDASQRRALALALREVPKSGEVWCEGARARLSPLSPAFDARASRRYLRFAIEFTPQYGDSFVEYARLLHVQALARLVEQKPHQNGNFDRADCDAALDADDLADLELKCANADPNYGQLWFASRRAATDTARHVLARARRAIAQEVLERHQGVYVAALRRRLRAVGPSDEPNGDDDAPDDHEAETEALLASAPPLAADDAAVQGYEPSDFVT